MDEELYRSDAEGSLIYQFDVVAMLNAAHELERRGDRRIAIEYDAEQFEHGPFSPDPRAIEGSRFVIHEARLDDEGLAGLRAHLEEIRARRAVVRRVWVRSGEGE